MNQVVVQAMLAELGETCVVTSNGREALTSAMAQAFALVLMDMRMPEMDGLAATRELREAERLASKPRVPVIAITANAESDDGATCLGAGMDGFLSKPFALTQLRLCLARGAPAWAASETMRRT